MQSGLEFESRDEVQLEVPILVWWQNILETQGLTVGVALSKD